MSEDPGFTKYRTVLDDNGEREFLIVTVMDNGSISWTGIGEAAYAACDCADLPDALHAQVSAVFGQLKFFDDSED